MSPVSSTPCAGEAAIGSGFVRSTQPATPARGPRPRSASSRGKRGGQPAARPVPSTTPRGTALWWSALGNRERDRAPVAGPVDGANSEEHVVLRQVHHRPGRLAGVDDVGPVVLE